MHKKKYKILLAGGSTGGPNAPLIATARKLQENYSAVDFSFLLVAPNNSPAERMSMAYEIPFLDLPEAKLRRYFSVHNLFLPFKLLYVFGKALKIVSIFRPDLIYGGGGFSQVPLILAGAIFRIPVVIHQQDVKITLSNQICAMFAKRITVSFKESLKVFPQGWFLSELEHVEKTVFTGNPSLLSATLPKRDKALQELGFESGIPTILFIGGGGGAKAFNSFVKESLDDLLKHFQVILITGPGKNKGFENIKDPRLLVYDFVLDMSSIYAASDIVVARAGMSTITELSKYGKLAIIVPMPDSHQEYNAEVLYLYRAAVVLDQSELNTQKFVQMIRKLLFEIKSQENYKKRISELLPKDADKRSAKVLWELLNDK